MSDIRADPIPKVPLSEQEYKALLALAGAINVFESRIEGLKKRAALVQDGLEDLGTVVKLLDKLHDGFIASIPDKKLKAIELAYDNAITELVVNRAVGYKKPQAHTYVPTDALTRITEKAMENCCEFCNLEGKDIKKCQLRKDFEAMYAWDAPTVVDGECVFNGLTVLPDELDL